MGVVSPYVSKIRIFLSFLSSMYGEQERGNSKYFNIFNSIIRGAQSRTFFLKMASLGPTPSKFRGFGQLKKITLYNRSWSLYPRLNELVEMLTLMITIMNSECICQ